MNKEQEIKDAEKLLDDNLNNSDWSEERKQALREYIKKLKNS